jgi:basic amino acid/polyamine antiporter, APA family
VLFSLWVTFASGYPAVYQALILVLAGLVLYAFLNARRERLGQIPNRRTTRRGCAVRRHRR